MFNKSKISTKNLYLCNLVNLSSENITNDNSIARTFIETRWILAKKSKTDGLYDTYIDIFTGTKHKNFVSTFTKIGESCITMNIPIVCDSNYLTKEDALKILELKNPTFFDLKNERESKIKNLLKRRKYEY